MRIKKYLLGAAIIANSVALTAAFVVTPASAAPQNEASTIEFGALEDASYSEVFDAIRASNDSEVAAEFFAVASEKPSAVDLPGLEELEHSREERST